MFSCCGFFSKKDENETEMKERGYSPLNHDMDVVTGLPRESRDKKGNAFTLGEYSKEKFQAKFGLSVDRMNQMDAAKHRHDQLDRRGLLPESESRSNFQPYGQSIGTRPKVTPKVIQQLKEEERRKAVPTPPGGLSLGVKRG